MHRLEITLLLAVCLLTQILITLPAEVSEYTNLGNILWDKRELKVYGKFLSINLTNMQINSILTSLNLVTYSVTS